MTHDEARELIEVAAAEPDGLTRLMAGDTPDAARLAGHLAECASCAEQLRAVGRSAEVIRAALREQPSPELRERTLAYVRGVGRPRGPGTGPAAAAVAAPVPVAAPAGRRRRWGLPAALAASIGGSAVLAAGIALAVVGADRDESEQRYEDTIAALAKVNVWTLRVDGEEDAARVALRSSDGTPAAATLVFSPSSTELVVVATELPEPPAGSEYRCWFEIDGRREGVGKMFFGGGLAYWVGAAPAVAGARDGARFGISLAPAGSTTPGDAEPVMVGEL